MTKNNAAAPAGNDATQADLDSRYGSIGISALAAAVQFQSEIKNPAYAPVVPRRDERLADMAA
jgi:hypothetical protein